MFSSGKDKDNTDNNEMFKLIIFVTLPTISCVMYGYDVSITNAVSTSLHKFIIGGLR